MTALPAEGRQGAPPRWPLTPDVVLATRKKLAAAKVDQLEFDLAEAEGTAKAGGLERKLDAAREKLAILDAQLRQQRRLEASLWKDLWALPQAVEWERQRWTRDVAQYVRHKVLAELGDMDAAREARQWSDRLGLSPMAMLRLRWRVAADEVAEQRQARQAGSARGRIKAVG
ncbi:hypothetical protein [Micromonospora humidisoli]|uniref:hypothetical protein n=1 Tax=Micromonospora sp. AKA109 TaxID=2733865 RepID=UPI00249210F4|nr:hypothetical protein [Micromonospora sp. AKA109]